MSILHLTHTDISKDSRILKELAVLAGYHPSSAVFAYGILSDENELQGRVGGNVTIRNFRIVCRQLRILPAFLRHFFTFLEFAIYAFWGCRSQRPKIVHVHDTLVLPIGFFIALFTGSKLIYDAHELEWDRNGTTILSKYITKLFEYLAWWRIDHFITVSDEIRGEYFNLYGEKDATVILNSPEICSDKSSKDLKKILGIDCSNIVALYVGQFSRGRGIEKILKYSRTAPSNLSFVFIGWGELEEEIQRQRAETKNVFLLEPVSHGEVVAYAASADIGLCLLEPVSLSDYYALPNKLFEYAFAKLPILASDFPSIKRVITEYGLGAVVDIEDHEAVQNAIQNITIEKVPASSKPLTDLAWTAQAQKLSNLYSELMKQKKEK